MTRAVLFHTCLVNEIDPEVGLAVVRVLERIGCDVDVPAAQTCCGQPAFNAGFQHDARTVARHTIDLLDRTTGPIVIPSGSCGDMLVHQYPHLFADEPAMHEKAVRVASRCREFSQFLAEHAPQHAGGTLDAKIAYHPSCHLLRGLGVREAPLDAIASVDGATSMPVREQEECCGFGGLFSVKNAGISSAMLDRKLAAIESSGADRVVSCDLGCLLHIGGGLHRRGSAIRTQHLAQLLDEAQTR
ncbi:MAG TPA: (Fe-S)-binding protein [Vicinamibacterales bacterium]|nr:(Fe-S)-binding protein [Vicinamibacterales bacterium]